MKRIVLNTDMFGDPDDLYALLFLLASSKVKIEMVITSDEHKCGRAAYTQKLLGDLDIDIPVYCGEDLGSVDCYLAPKPKTKIDNNYVEALEALKGKFSFLCISPLSELSDIIDIIKERKVETIIMGGSTKKSEHNIKCNIPAVLKVLQANINAKWVPSDLTMNENIKIDREHPIYKEISKSKSVPAKYLKQNTDRFFKKLYPAHFLHDPLAISILFDNEIVKFKQKTFDLKEAQFFPSKKGFIINYGISADYDRFWKIFNKHMKQWF